MKQKNISLQVRLRPGLIVRLMTTLSGLGFKLTGQKQHPPNPQGLSQLLLTLEGPREIDKDVCAALLALEGVAQCAAEAESSTAAGRGLESETLQQLLREAFLPLEAAFPRIQMQVRSFGRELGGAQRDLALSALGRQLGRRKYRKEFAEGIPLPLAQALLRIVVPVLRTLTPVEIQGSQIALSECVLCEAESGGVSSCAFCAGLIQGLLEDSPATKGLSVSVASCRTRATINLNTCLCAVNAG